MSKEKIIQQGAEAVLIQEGRKLIKRRIKKSYRIPEIDERLRKLRTRSEAKILEKVSSLIKVPKVIHSNESDKEIEMEFLDGETLSDVLDSFNLKRQNEIMKKIGKSVAKLHAHDVIHSDLTTSNFIFQEKGDEVYFVDFGLSFISKRIEDKAVDLHLLKEALEARHFKHWQTLFKTFKKGYEEYKDSEKVFEQLEKVESRGRYKFKI